MVKIVQITTHLGGGIGKALSSIAVYGKKHGSDFSYTMVLLEKPEKEQFVDICREGNIGILIEPDRQTIKNTLAEADVVVLNWHHHPVMMKFLSDFPVLPVRLILWSHVNGCNYPMLPYNFIEIMHKTFFTTNYSLENPLYTAQQWKELKNRAVTIYGLGELSNLPVNRKNNGTRFVIGYVGTLNFSKLNPEYAHYCRAVIDKIPSARFVVVGEMNNEKLLNEIKEHGLQGYFEFIGYTKSVSKELARFDVFGYPLNPFHFGATENALLEAMAARVPVVALNQSTEKHIIRHTHTGYLADSINHYAEIMKYLSNHREEGIRVGRNAAEYVKREFSMEKNVHNMEKAFVEVMEMPKRTFEFLNIFGNEPHEWFLSCAGENQQLFIDNINNPEDKNVQEKIRHCQPIFREKSKSSILHFAQYFGDDIYIKRWSKMVETYD